MSGPAELVQPGVVDAEVVGDLVHDGNGDLTHHLGLAAAAGDDRLAVDGDAVGHPAADAVVVAAGGEGHPLVEPEQPPLARPVLDEDGDVVDQAGQLVGDAVEGVGHQLLEPLGADVDHGRSIYGWGVIPADQLLADLDDEQREAVTTDSLPLCVLAGAGSGKTRVLTRRIAWRCATGRIDASHVLALTFTRAAARELRSRLRRMGLRDDVAAGTFHAVAWSELRAWHAERGTRPPALLEQPGRLLARVVDRDRGAVPELVAEIGWARARLVTPDRYAAEAARSDRSPTIGTAAVAEAFARYETEKRRRGVVDFDDLLARWTEIVIGDPAVAAAQRWRFSHLFVDELQDLNPLQFQLLEAWRGGRDDLSAVGDPNQAIYGWNGADPRFIERFAEHYPGGSVVAVTTSYRSTPEILALANGILDTGGLGGVRLHGVRPSGPAPTVTAWADEHEEALAVARSVLDGHAPGTAWRHQAVLVRTNAQLGVLQAALRAVGVPVRLRGEARLTDHPAVAEALRDLGRPGRSFVEAVAALEASLDSAASDADRDGDRPPVLRHLLELADDYRRVEPRADVRGFRAFLAATAGEATGRSDAVELATFHAAKGLEWPTVHVCGVEEGFVPISHARRPDALVEERRLFYVACTRAERVLRISWAAQRSLGAGTYARRASPYLEDVAPVLHRLAAEAAPADGRQHLPAPRAEVASAAGAPAVPAAGAVDPETAAAVAALGEWRSHRARAGGVSAAAVLPDRVLRALARARPVDPAGLQAVAGTGVLTAAGLVEEVLSVLRSVQDAGHALPARAPHRRHP